MLNWNGCNRVWKILLAGWRARVTIRGFLLDPRLAGTDFAISREKARG